MSCEREESSYPKTPLFVISGPLTTFLHVTKNTMSNVDLVTWSPEFKQMLIGHVATKSSVMTVTLRGCFISVACARNQSRKICFSLQNCATSGL